MNKEPGRSPSRRLAITGLLVAMILVALFGTLLWTRQEDERVTSPSAATPSSVEALPTRTTRDIRDEVVERLRQILQVRDKAFRERNAAILTSLYTTDCPCLEGDRNAIRELTENNYHVVGGTTSVRVRRVERVTDRAWLVIADFRSAPLRIEAKDNRLIREKPAGSDLFQFALSKPTGSQEWLLGQATAYKDSSG
jgi:uncharacterized membrane protein